MTFTHLGIFIEYGMSIWFCAIFFLISWKIARGEIITSGLLVSAKTGSLQFHRLQLMAATLLFAFGYLYTGLKHGEAGLPNIPPVVLFGLLGSQGAYLAGKYRSGGRRRGQR